MKMSNAPTLSVGEDVADDAAWADAAHMHEREHPHDDDRHHRLPATP